jgi:outer membrane protein OmpA-like peptidoglycan-associated protein
MDIFSKMFFFILFLPAVCQGQSLEKQEKIYNKALESYRDRNFSGAVIQVQKVLAMNPRHLGSCLLMADIYYDTNNPSEEIIWLKKASLLPGVPLSVYYRLAEACFRTGGYREAFESVQRLEGQTFSPGLQEKVKRLKANCEFAVEAVKRPVLFQPEKLDQHVNSEYDEYWPSLTVDDNTLVFTRLIPVNEFSGLKQEDFYTSTRDSAGWKSAGWKPAVPVSDLNSPQNEGAQSVSADGKLLFFTLCNRPEGFGSCDIWFSKLENGKWSAPRNAGEPVNTPGWEGQPSYSSFGDFLYFSSDRQGGKGKKDIWRVSLKGWDSSGMPEWGDLTNPGDSINTPGVEISPFIHPNGRDLYFSSDSWPGFGGLDLFHAKELQTGQWTKAKNLGYPVNSPGNEQGLIIDRTGMTAYYATSMNQEGNMDIYRFQTEPPFRPEPVTYIRGKVTNATTGTPISALVEITCSEKACPFHYKVRADEKGAFLITLPPDQDVSFTVNEKGFLFYSEQFRFQGHSTPLEPLERQISLVPAEPGKSIDLYNIFFSTNEFSLLPESEPELQTVVVFLKQNPSLSVEIGGHTDSKGSPAFNLTLSGKRAQSVMEYLLKNGIQPGRLNSQGYGMDFPVATNDTEENRSKNRRTTLKIISTHSLGK